MRGSFSIDLLFALFILLLFLQVTVPRWGGFVDAEQVAVCYYLGDLLHYEENLAASLGMDVNFDSLSSGTVQIRGGEIYVNGVRCP